jgi:hypothetical protein
MPSERMGCGNAQAILTRHRRCRLRKGSCADEGGQNVTITIDVHTQPGLSRMPKSISTE